MYMKKQNNNVLIMMVENSFFGDFLSIFVFENITYKNLRCNFMASDLNLIDF